ncbi:MAG: hypothetical protein AB7Q42_24165 [Acidimicrobiia bacterium]
MPISSSPAASGGDVDHAALLGAVVAAVLSLTITDGQWTSLNTCIGLLLLAVVLGFAPPTRPAGESYRAIGWFARCGVVGICTALTIAWPLQRLLIEMDDVCLFRSDTIQAYDRCVAGRARSWLWLAVVLATALCAVVTAPSYWRAEDPPAAPGQPDRWSPPG